MLNILKHPLTRDLNLDDPRTTLLRRQIIKEKPFLNNIYQDWYSWIVAELSSKDGLVVELGSGAGFLDEYIPGLVTSEIFPCPFVKMVLDGCALPFADGSLRAVVMVDVFHHIPDAELFLSEAQRCLCSEGRILMIEPWVTAWSRLVYRYLHHEPFDPEAKEWCFPSSGPLSGANSALPWIVFDRDRGHFERKFPELCVHEILIEMPFRYLLSGGISLRSLMPSFSFRLWKSIESFINPLSDKIGMFAKIILCKV